MAGIIEGLRQRLGIGGARRKKQLEGLEERSTNPTAAERVVVRPTKKVKKRVVVKK
jgi:hypothetical protein